MKCHFELCKLAYLHSTIRRWLDEFKSNKSCTDLSETFANINPWHFHHQKKRRKKGIPTGHKFLQKSEQKFLSVTWNPHCSWNHQGVSQNLPILTTFKIAIITLLVGYALLKSIFQKTVLRKRGWSKNSQKRPRWFRWFQWGCFCEFLDQPLFRSTFFKKQTLGK